MKRIVGLCCVLVLLFSLPALAFNQADVDRLNAGDKNMHGADLSGAQLVYDPYTDVDFSGANLTGAIMIGRIFQNCNFQGANFTDVQFRATRFSGCNLSDQDFSGLELSNQHFTQCILRNVRFNGALMDNLLMYQNDIAGAKLANATLKGGRWYKADGTGISWDSVKFQQPAIVLDSVKIKDVYKPYLSTQIPVNRIEWVVTPKRNIDPSKIQNKKAVKTYKPTTPKGVQKGMLPVKQ